MPTPSEWDHSVNVTITPQGHIPIQSKTTSLNTQKFLNFHNVNNSPLNLQITTESVILPKQLEIYQKKKKLLLT